MAEVALEPQAGVPEHGPDPIAGRSPWALAVPAPAPQPHRVRRRSCSSSLIVLSSFAAPLYANHIAHTDPFENNLNGTTIVNGKEVPLMQQGGGVLQLGETPIGPTWDVHHYFLGADAQGRDVAWRVCSTAAAARSLVGIGSARDRVPHRDRARADRRLLRRGSSTRSCHG